MVTFGAQLTNRSKHQEKQREEQVLVNISEENFSFEGLNTKRNKKNKKKNKLSFDKNAKTGSSKRKKAKEADGPMSPVEPASHSFDTPHDGRVIKVELEEYQEPNQIRKSTTADDIFGGVADLRSSKIQSGSNSGRLAMSSNIPF